MSELASPRIPVARISSRLASAELANQIRGLLRGWNAYSLIAHDTHGVLFRLSRGNQSGRMALFFSPRAATRVTSYVFKLASDAR